jgi:hypothetical protein
MERQNIVLLGLLSLGRGNSDIGPIGAKASLTSSSLEQILLGKGRLA